MADRRLSQQFKALRALLGVHSAPDAPPNESISAEEASKQSSAQPEASARPAEKKLSTGFYRVQRGIGAANQARRSEPPAKEDATT